MTGARGVAREEETMKLLLIAISDVLFWVSGYAYARQKFR